MSRVTIPSLLPGVSYGLQLRAVSNGATSDWSRSFTITPPGDTVAPATPTGLTTSQAGTSFIASWNANTESDLLRYVVRVTAPTFGTVFFNTVATNFDFPLDLNRSSFGTPKATIEISVAAMDRSGNLSAYVGPSSQTNPAPGNPTAFSGNGGPDVINLKWTGVTDSDLMEYRVYSGTTSGSQTTLVWKGLSTNVALQSIEYTTDKWFKVVAADVFGTESTTPPVVGPLKPTSAFLVDSTPPAVPTGLTATLTTQNTAGEILVSAAVSWTAVADPDNDLAGYKIGYRSVGSSDWQYTDVDYTSTSTKIDRLTAYVNYEFRIRSYDFSANYSAWSSTFTTTTAGTNAAPAAPTGLLGAAGASTVTVLWTENAETDVKNGNGMYEVQMDTVNTFNSANLQTIKTAAIVASFRTDGLAAGNRFIRVRAVDSFGLAGAYSSTLTVNQTDVGATEAYTQSRGMNLVTNGAGALGNNKNFTTLTFDAADRPFGGGSFHTTTQAALRFNDELMPVDVQKTYTLTAYARSRVPGNTTSKLYIGIAAFDVDGNAISSTHHMYVANTLTTLAAPLNPGDTTVTLTSAANWYNSTSTSQKGLIFWNYTDSKGYTYPENTYSRNVSASQNMWASGGITGNVITLSAPWAGAAYAAGTKVSNGSAGATYKYIAATNVNVPETWTKYTGYIGGVDYTGQNVANMFVPGTAYAKLLLLMNYTGSPAGSNQGIGGVSFSEVAAQNLLPNTMGGDVVIANTMAGDRVIANTLDANTLKANTSFVQDLNVKSTFTVGDASTAGVMRSYEYVSSSGAAGWRFADDGLIIKTGAIEAPALKIQDSDNIIPPEYASFEFVPSFYTGKLTVSGATNTIVTSGGRFGSQYLQSRATAAAAFGVSIGQNSTDYNFPLEPSATYIVSAWMKTGSVASNVSFRIRQNVGYTASFGAVTLPASGGWQRVTGSITTSGIASSGLLVIDSNTATIGAGFDVDGIQVERQVAGITTPSPWTPPGFTSVDGGIIRTGEIRSTSTTTVNGVSQPAWSINMSGNAQFGDAMVRGKILVGQSGADADAGQSFISSGNYVAATTGWKLDSSGNLEANSGTFRGTLSGGTILGGSGQFPASSSNVPGFTTIDGNGFSVNNDATTNLCTNPAFASLTGVSASTGTTAVLGGAAVTDYQSNVDIVPYVGATALKVYNTTQSGYVDISAGAAQPSTTYTISWVSATTNINDAPAATNVKGDFATMGIIRNDTSARIFTGRTGNVAIGRNAFAGLQAGALSTGIADIAALGWQVRTWITLTTPSDLPAGTILKLRLPAPRTAANGNETTLAVVYDAIQMEQKSYMTRYCDGDQPQCNWSGTRNASTSSRSAIKSFWTPTFDEPVFSGNVNSSIVTTNKLKLGTGALRGSNFVERFNSAVQSFNNAAWTDIPFESNAGSADRTAQDDGTITGPTFAQFLTNLNGMYQISTTYTFATNANGNRGLRIIAQSPGGTDSVIAQHGPYPAANFALAPHIITLPVLTYLPPGYKIRVQAYQSAGGVLASVAHSTTTPCRFTMAMVS